MGTYRSALQRLALVVVAGVVTTTALAALGQASAQADPIGSGTTSGGGSYSVTVSVTGSGVGSGGDLGGGSAVSSGGGTVSVPSPCGMTPIFTQAQLESDYTSKEDFLQRSASSAATAAGHGYDNGGPTGQAWTDRIAAYWGGKKSGTWYTAECDGNAPGKVMTDFFANNAPVLVGPNGEVGALPQPTLDPEFLMQIAQRAMTLPKIATVGINPKARTYVTLKNYLWVEPQMQPNETRSVTASAGGVSETVTATYQSTSFQAGSDGVVCADGGRPYTGGAGTACQLTFHTASTGLTVAADSTWTAQWVGHGALPGADMRGQTTVQVAEIQTLDR